MHRQSFKRLLAGAAALAATALSLPAGAQAASSFTLGFNDDDLSRYSGFVYSGAQTSSVDEPALNAGLANGRSAGAAEWRFMIVWARVARNATTAPSPASLAADPAWSGYVWDDVDRMVRGITAQGMVALPWVARAPAWAEGANRPTVSKDYPAGTWRPSAPMLEQFAKALARRYSGTYPDPVNPGEALPRVATFQGWNEPNLFTEITPQWVRSGTKWKVESVGIYRGLLNAFYRGVKASQPKATVLSAGTGPFGDLYDGERRLQPARFYRDLLCVTKASTGALKAKKTCPKIRFDGWAHHTYPIGPPTRTARNADDVVVPDMAKLTKIVGVAQRAGRISKKTATNVWMTEMSWESLPDPNGLSLDEHALYMQGAFYVLWKAGVQHVLWWTSRDNAQGADWNTSHQSGIFTRGANPTLDGRKPAFTAFRFPFAAYRSKGVAALWTKPPAAGPVTVEALSAGTWKPVATLKPGRGGVMTGRLRAGPGVTLRAVQGADVSLPWRTF